MSEVWRHYRNEAGDALAERFWQELMARLNEVAERPERFSPYLGHPRFRRARLKRFPYLIVFRVLRDRVRIMVIKHEKRHPAFGMNRR